MVQHQARGQGERRGEGGFTLVEIMLAVALLSIIVTVMYSSFHTMGRIMRRTQRTKGAYQAARLIMSRMRQDLGCAHFSPTRKNYIFRGEDILGADGAADALTFVTTGHVISGRDVPEGDMAEVSYYLDEQNPGLLVRREDISPDDELEVGGVLDILGKDVVGLNFTYLDGRQEPPRRAGGTTTALDEAEEERNAWKEEWDTDETAYLPRAVKIDLSLLNEQEEIEDFSTTVVLAMGRTATSSVPTVQQTSVQRRPTGATQRGGPRPGRGPGRGDRRDGGPGRGGGRGDRRDGGRGGREGSRGMEGMRRPSGSGSQQPGAPRIQRNVPNAPRTMRGPTPGGRR